MGKLTLYEFILSNWGLSKKIIYWFVILEKFEIIGKAKLPIQKFTIIHGFGFVKFVNLNLPHQIVV